MKKLIPAILLVASANAYAQAPPSAEQILKDNDKNSDGVITKEEAKGSELEMFFDLVDGNHDGTITMDELKAIPGNGAPPSGGPGGPPSGSPPASQGGGTGR